MKKFKPDFAAFAKIQENLLTGRLDAARKSISHAGEKGRSLEFELASLLRSFLPAEYGLATGFVAYRTDKETLLTPQLDLIIYDAVRCGPLVRLATCDVFPLEAVYGYIEVKASLTSSSDDAKSLAMNSIEHCMKLNGELRKLRVRHFWRPVAGSSVMTERVPVEWLALRGYVVAFSSSGGVVASPKGLAQRMADVATRPDSGHLHGVLVAGGGFYSMVAVDASNQADIHNVVYTTSNPMAAFKASLLLSLNRFPRFPQSWAPAVDVYDKMLTWKKRGPKKIKQSSRRP